MDKLFSIENLQCSYDKFFVEGRSKVVLHIRELDIPRAHKVFIVGESGIGKSTILEVLGMMNNTIVPNSATRFSFYEDPEHVVDLLALWKSNSDKALSAFRLKHFNFIFQSTNLMRNFTAYENIALTRMLQGYSAEECYRKTSDVLNDLGLPHIDRTRMAQELSGGQQQRLAFARAILPDFTVLFGDEPTGNLDADNAVRAMKLLSVKLDELSGASAIIVSHDMHLAVTFADTIIKIRKEFHAARDEHDDVSAYGVIDRMCVFTKDAVTGEWGNGEERYTEPDFEKFLKKIS